MREPVTSPPASCPAAEHIQGAAAPDRNDGAAAEAAREVMVFGTLPADRDLVKLYVGVTVFVTLLAAALLRPPLPEIIGKASVPKAVRSVKVASGAELVEQLKKYNLWQITAGAEIPAVVFVNYPANLDQLRPEVRKRTFLHTLLPAVKVALDEVRSERAALEMILARLGDSPAGLDFNDFSAFSGRLTGEEARFLARLSAKYRTSLATELLARVNILPASLIMAQGALESSWGGSRFVREANNLFGVWTWNGPGIVPDRRDDGKRHRVARYDSILDSVRAYVLMINRVPAYRYLRSLRRRTMDPLALADGLLYYSERRQDYVAEVKKVIRGNRLQEYDAFLWRPLRRS